MNLHEFWNGILDASARAAKYNQQLRIFLKVAGIGAWASTCCAQPAAASAVAVQMLAIESMRNFRLLCASTCSSWRMNQAQQRAEPSTIPR
jgi:hypothetical protein